MVDELALFVDDEMWVKRALVIGVTGSGPSQARSRKGDPSNPARHRYRFLVLAIPTLYSERSRFGRKSRCAYDDARYTNEVGDISRVEIADRNLGNGGVEEELMLWEIQFVGFY